MQRFRTFKVEMILIELSS